MSWIELVPAFVACAAVLVAPGALVARAAGVPAWLALGAGPGLSVAFYAVLAVVLARSGVAWSPVTVGLLALGCLVVVAAVAVLARRATRSGWERVTGLLPGSDGLGAGPAWSGTPSEGSSHGAGRRWAPSTWSWRVWVCAAVAVSAVVTVVPTMIGMGAPDAPLQQWDAVYHLNGLALIQETGDASQLNGLYGAGASVYYPTAWHAAVSLVVSLGGPLTASSITAAANASTLVMSVVWVLGAAAFARAVLPHRPAVTVLAALAVSAFSMFPTVQLATLAQWPNGLATMLIPGAAAAVVTATRSWRSHADRTSPPVARMTSVVLTALALGSAAGVALAQPSGFVGLAVVLAPFVVTVLAVVVRDAWRGGRRTAVLVPAVLVVVFVTAAALVLSRSSVLDMVFGFARAPQRSIPVSVARILTDTVLTPVPGNIVVSVLVVVGAVVLLRRRRHRWLVVSAGLVVALAALAAGPENPLRLVTGIWYTQAARIEAFYPVPAAVLAAVGALAVVDRVRASGRVRDKAPGALWLRSPVALTGALLLVAFVTSAAFQAPQRAVRFAQAYDPASIQWGTMLSVDELELMRDLPEIVGDDAVVLGDPFSGAPYAWSVGRTHVVLPQLNISGLDPDRQYLVDHFDDVTTDPRVCEAVRELGVTHFYVDRTKPRDGAKRSPLGPALSEVDVSTGFVPVATAGDAALYALTACG